MRAAFLTQPQAISQNPLTVESVPMLARDPQQVLLRVRACGVCTVNGGFAEYATARRDFVFPLPSDLDDLHAAPLLCAGIIGFRSLRVAGVEPGERVGLFGFGSSAHLMTSVLQAWGCPIYVSTRGESHRKLANELGATWVGRETDRPPIELDRAVTFAPSGDVVVAALASLRKGGIVAINAIH